MAHAPLQTPVQKVLSFSLVAAGTLLFAALSILAAALRVVREYVLRLVNSGNIVDNGNTKASTGTETTADNTPQLSASGVGAGHTVLVTTGRQIKTLQTVRALKAVGARVIVADYHPISTSALSVCCDAFAMLPPLDPARINGWVDDFEALLVRHGVDTVVPISTINEVLFVAHARDVLSARLPHVRWLCPTLNDAVLLDDREAFSALCMRHGVTVPESGLAHNRADVPLDRFKTGIVVKRVESTLNRLEEVVILDHAAVLPQHCQPSAEDPWQWQRRIIGRELSAWYVCDNGVVTFSACYVSGMDIVHFDAVKAIPSSLDAELRGLIAAMNLSGQYAFDFLQDKAGDCYVIECNPRASTVLATVSNTPLWAECFFGSQIPESRVVHSNMGLLIHKTCWPFVPHREEGAFSWTDPLPFLGAEVAWPLWAIGQKGCTSAGWKLLDCNIGKIVVDGPSPARHLAAFNRILRTDKLALLRSSLAFVDVTYVDVSVGQSADVLEACSTAGSGSGTTSTNRVVPFVLRGKGRASDLTISGDVVEVNAVADIADLEQGGGLGFAVRAVLAPGTAQDLGMEPDIALVIPESGKPATHTLQVPLRKMRLLHVMGGMASHFYENLSSLYGFQCIESMGDSTRFEHVVAYVFPGGACSITEGKSLDEIRQSAPRMSVGDAIGKIQGLNVDVVVPHMFDYVGLTAFRSLFDILNLPLIGCTGEALALSTNKAKTKACAAQAGVRVPSSDLIRPGMKPTIELPFIVKPTEEDNSIGIKVVREESEIDSALDTAFQYGDELLCEQFIPLGRELRAAVVEGEDGNLELLPVIEYFLSKENPIRDPEAKLTTNSAGMPTTQFACKRQIPADVDDTLRKKLFEACSTAHVALGCRDYSIYDFRVDPEGEPYMLESSLYCSFSPKSAIVMMAATQGVEHPKLFVQFCERVFARHERRTRMAEKDQKFGMKAR